MKITLRISAATLTMVMLLAPISRALAQESIELTPKENAIALGDSLQLAAAYYDTSGTQIDTSFTWSVVPDSLGSITATGLFTALRLGTGEIYINLGSLADTASITVVEPAPEVDHGILIVSPSDTTISVGDSILFQVTYHDTVAGTYTDTTADWSLQGSMIGTISDTGILAAMYQGTSTVRARLGSLEASAFVTVIDTTVDITGVNTILISRVMPDGKILPPREVEEGEEYVMGGLPFPLNILNGTRFYFPMGSLSEDIEVRIQVPKFAKVKKKDVEFSEGVVTGFDAVVYVADMPVSPYYFNIPLSVAIPFKRGLLKKLNIDPSTLGMFFAEDSVTFDTTGIYEVTVDTSANRIFSQVAHFSTVVVKGKVTTPGSLELENEIDVVMLGDSHQFAAVYRDSSGVEVDTTFEWSVVPKSLGSIDSTGLFTALRTGEGTIFVRLGTLVDSAPIAILGSEDGLLVITPGDTALVLGDSLQFQAMYYDTVGAMFRDTTATWSLHGGLIGTLSTTGLLRTTSQGLAMVHAQLGSWQYTALVVVADTAADSSGVNTILLSRITPDGQTISPRTIYEGEDIVMAGLPFPLNVLNGTRLFFPMGSLDDDIEIRIKLPEFAKMKGTDVEFVAGVVAGFDAEVYIADTLVSPFYFNTPLSAAIPFKRGLLRKLEIDPANLGMFFALDSTTFDTTGIYDAIVDSTADRVFSQVAHFSTLVVGDAAALMGLADEGNEALPTSFVLRQNYPNPFNPTTTIEYSLPRTADVTLVVYDIIGREMTRLVDGLQASGYHGVVWNGRTVTGRELPSGIYFARLVAGEFTQTIKLVLLK